MLYFSKLKLVTIYTIIIFLSLLSLANLSDNNNNYFLSKKVNLGLDLQGGSYLLLEVDSNPVIKEKLQNKLISLRKALKNKKIKYQNLKIENKKISFLIQENEVERFEQFFLNKDNLINLYYNQYKSYELDHFINDNLITIKMFYCLMYFLIIHQLTRINYNENIFFVI